MTFHAVFPTVMMQKAAFSLPEQTFDFLEKPEYYFDGYHLNARGRQRFTETLVTELVGRLRSADSPTDLDSRPKAVARRLVLDIYGPSAGSRNETCMTMKLMPGID